MGLQMRAPYAETGKFMLGLWLGLPVQEVHKGPRIGVGKMLPKKATSYRDDDEKAGSAIQKVVASLREKKKRRHG